jgi:hypothetical protein
MDSMPRRPTSRLLLLTALFLVVLPLAGCGGSDSAPSVEDFQESVVTSRNQVDYALARITRAKSKEELLNRMTEASVVIDDVATKLDDAGAAEGFESDTDKLTSALGQLSADLSAFAHDAAQPEGEVLLTGNPGLNFDSWDDANAALASMQATGIDVELIGRH